MSGGAYIPGVNDTYKSQEAIEKIMEPKRAKLDKMEEEKGSYKDKKVAWDEIRQKAVALQGYAKKLYGFDSPFEEKISQSSDENAFAANVTRNAEIGEHRIEIVHKARPHKIASMQLGKKYSVPAGDYNFNVGDSKVRVRFSGGSLDQFAAEIKKDSKNKLRASVTRDTVNTQILVLETVETGEKNRITFEDQKTKDLFKKMGFFENVIAYDKKFDINTKSLENLSEIKMSPKILDGGFRIGMNQRFKYNLIEKIPYKDQLVMEVDLRLEKLDPAKLEASFPTGPNFSKDGDLTLFDIHVDGESSIVDIPEFKKPKINKVVEDDHYIEIVTNKRTIKFDELDVSDTKKTLAFDMNEVINKDEVIESVIFKNNNTLKELEVGKVRFYDKGSEAGVRYNQELSGPRDAFIKLDGIDVKRDTNTIDDLIKGTTLLVFDKTEREETLKIDRDYEKILGSISEFLTGYNEFIDIISEKTNTDEDAEGNKGEFPGDTMLLSLVSKLRMISMNAYPTSFGQELTMLSQVGISTNVSKDRKMDTTKLKGKLEIDDKVLFDKIEKYAVGVKELFGSDSDQDLIIDTGVGYNIEQLLKLSTQKGNGFFDMKMASCDSQIKRLDKDMESYRDRLDREERDLRQKFYKMEKAAHELEENSNRFDNLNKGK